MLLPALPVSPSFLSVTVLLYISLDGNKINLGDFVVFIL